MMDEAPEAASEAADDDLNINDRDDIVSLDGNAGHGLDTNRIIRDLLDDKAMCGAAKACDATGPTHNASQEGTSQARGDEWGLSLTSPQPVTVKTGIDYEVGNHIDYLRPTTGIIERIAAGMVYIRNDTGGLDMMNLGNISGLDVDGTLGEPQRTATTRADGLDVGGTHGEPQRTATVQTVAEFIGEKESVYDKNYFGRNTRYYDPEFPPAESDELPYDPEFPPAEKDELQSLWDTWSAGAAPITDESKHRPTSLMKVTYEDAPTALSGSESTASHSCLFGGTFVVSPTPVKTTRKGHGKGDQKQTNHRRRIQFEDEEEDHHLGTIQRKTKPPVLSFADTVALPVFEEEFDEGGTMKVTSGNCQQTLQAFLHCDTQLPGFNSVLVDCGAVYNLTGSEVIQIQAKEAEEQGQPASWYKLDKPKNVSGVGDRAKTCEFAVQVPCVLESGRKIEYISPVIGGSPSPCPSLYGLDPMAIQNVHMGMRTGLLAMVPDGQESNIIWPKGTTFEQCRKSQSGHWNLVINAWKAEKKDGVYAESLGPSSPTEEYGGNCHNCQPDCACRFWSSGSKRPYVSQNDVGHAAVMRGSTATAAGFPGTELPPPSRKTCREPNWGQE